MARAYRRLSWAPLATFIGTWAYIGRYDGWGAWAAAPLLLLPIGLSGAMGVVGLALCLGSRRDGIDRGTALATLLAALPLLWFALRLVTGP